MNLIFLINLIFINLYSQDISTPNLPQEQAPVQNPAPIQDQSTQYIAPFNSQFQPLPKAEIDPNAPKIMIHAFEYELANVISNTVISIRENPSITCSIINQTLKQIKTEQYRWKNENISHIRESIFYLKQVLIQSIGNNLSDCKSKGKIEELYFKVLETEKLIIHDLRFGHNQEPYPKVKENIAPELENFSISKYLNGSVNDLQTGDLVLSSNIMHQNDWSRAVTETDSLYSHVGMIYIEEKTKTQYVISIEAGTKGIGIRELSSYVKENFYTLLFLRAKDKMAAKKAGDYLYGLVNNIPIKKRINLFDYYFDITDQSRFYCSELVIHGFNQTSSYLKNINLETHVDFFDKSILVKFFNKNNATIAFPKSFIFSGKFDIIAEWTYIKAERINYISYLISKSFLSINFKDLNIELDLKYKLLNFLWDYRENSIVEKILYFFKIKKDGFGVQKFPILYIKPKLVPSLTKCMKEIGEQDFTNFYKLKKKVWLTDEEVQSLYTECFLTDYKNSKN